MNNFTREECNAIIEYAANNIPTHVSKFALFKGLDYTRHGLFRNEKTQWVFDKLSRYLSDKFPDNKVKELAVVNVHKFNVGGEFIKHVDVDREPTFYYIIGTSLNDGYVGGSLNLFDPDEEVAYLPGILYGMSATRPHEVTKIESGERWSLVLFLTREDLGIKKNLI